MTNTSWADNEIPLSVGSYLTTSESVTTGTINNNDNGNLGSIQSGATATFTLTNASAQDMVLTFLTGNNNDSSPQVTVTMNDDTQDFFTKTVDIEKTGSWNPVTLHAFDLGNVPAGTVTLRFAFTNTGSYVCNLGSIGLYSKTAVDVVPGNITLNKGVYQTARVENAGNVGYVSNGAMASYIVNNSTAGMATLSMGLQHYGDGTINVVVQDATTGNIEITKNITINSSVCQGLDTPTDFELGEMTAGLKIIKMKFSTSASYLCNYKNVSLAVTPSSWKDIAIDLRNGQLGTIGNNLVKYLTIDGNDNYNYADEAPETYNAKLSASSYNGSDHGYVNLKAGVPLTTGIYKITLGTCQFGTGTGYVKNADESSTLNIVDANGQVQTSFNQNTGACYHNNTTSNVISVWYEATADQTITVACGNYTPYFAIERVNALPEAQYVVTYQNNTDGATGTVPATVAVSVGNSITLPVNRTLYKDGYTLTGWNDGVNTYAPGANYTPTANTTMTAVFTANAYSVTQSLAAHTARWDFQTQNGCPTVAWEGRTGDFLVTQTTVNGNSVDVKLDINTTPGKFNNASNTDWCQVNEGTTLSFPAAAGAVVTAYSMNEPKNNSDVKSTLNGNEYSSYSSYVATYSAAPTEGMSTLTVKGGSYYRYVEITYPAVAVEGITAITVGGIAVDGDVIADINYSNNRTATLTGNVYTSEPTVTVTMSDASVATITPSGTGTTRTYTINGMDNTYTLTVEGIHIYSASGNDETVQLKYTSAENDKNTKVWSNGVYSLSPVGDGWNNSGFKLSKNDGPFTLTVPSDVQVKQFIIRDFIDNYTAGSFNTITSEGMTTAYIPTVHDFGYSQSGGGGRAKYDLIINLEGHQAGQPITFSFTGGSQITGWYELTVAHNNPSTPPAKTAESVTVVNNHAVVAVTFDREIPNSVNATINNETVTAEGGSATLYFPVWNLEYSTNYTLNIAAGAVADAYNNTNADAIEIAVNVPAKAAVTMAIYDYVVSNANELKTAITDIEDTNKNSSAARKTIFLKNGDYDLGSSNETVQWVRAYNVSFIGESRDGVIIHGTSDGISNPVLNLRDRTGFYLQDLTVRNDKNYGLEVKEGVAVAIYGGDKTIMKNVRMQSNQDTQVTGHRAYFEDCKIHGTVDFICGGGDNFYYHTDLILEDRGGNVITAPSTNSAQKWGYVFQECTISAVDDAAATTNSGSYFLGRPWQNEPRSYFLNTAMNVQGKAAGWTSMSNNLTTHFYEYNSKDANGQIIDLSNRTNSPNTANSYIPVLSDEEAAKFTVQNVLGGTDSWLPTEECVTLSAPNITLSGATLSWEAIEDARCYVILKDGEYLTNQTGNSYTITSEGTYTVKAANERGGLGNGASLTVEAIATNTHGNASHVAVKAMDFSDVEGLKAYIATAADNEGITLAQVTAVPAGTAFVVQATEKSAQTYYIPTTTKEVTLSSQNVFQGNATKSTATESGYTYYALSKSKGMFAKVGSSVQSIPAGKAFVKIQAGGGAKETLAFIINGETTGIAEAEAVESQQNGVRKQIINGQLIIIKGDKKYNAAGGEY